MLKMCKVQRGLYSLVPTYITSFNFQLSRKITRYLNFFRKTNYLESESQKQFSYIVQPY